MKKIYVGIVCFGYLVAIKPMDESSGASFFCIPSEVIVQIAQCMIENRATSFYESVRSVVNFSSVNTYLRNVFKQKSSKKLITNTLIKKMGGSGSFNLQAVDSSDAAHNLLVDVSKNRIFLLEESNKIECEDLMYKYSFFLFMLFQKGADINFSFQEKTPLYYAIQSNHRIEFIEAMLASGAERNVQTPGSKDTGLMLARKFGRREVFKLLLTYGADSSIQDEYGATVFDQRGWYFGSGPLSCDDMNKIKAEVEVEQKKQRIFKWSSII